MVEGIDQSRVKPKCIVLRAELARIATRLLMLVDSVDKVAANEDALKNAAVEFQTILENVRPTYKTELNRTELHTHVDHVVKH